MDFAGGIHMMMIKWCCWYTWLDIIDNRSHIWTHFSLSFPMLYHYGSSPNPGCVPMLTRPGVFFFRPLGPLRYVENCFGLKRSCFFSVSIFFRSLSFLPFFNASTVAGERTFCLSLSSFVQFNGTALDSSVCKIIKTLNRFPTEF